MTRKWKEVQELEERLNALILRYHCVETFNISRNHYGILGKGGGGGGGEQLSKVTHKIVSVLDVCGNLTRREGKKEGIEEKEDRILKRKMQLEEMTQKSSG